MDLNIGCGPHYALGWHNIDVHDGDGVHPDEVVPTFRPEFSNGVGRWLPYEDGSVQRVMLGHVLEHLPWASVPDFLLAVKRVLHHTGTLCVVGPDTRRALELWQAGSGHVPREILDACLEDDSAYMLSDGKVAGWEGARHQWNCYEARVAAALRATGFVVESHHPGSVVLEQYPVVSRAPWQFFCVARPS